MGMKPSTRPVSIEQVRIVAESASATLIADGLEVTWPRSAVILARASQVSAPGMPFCAELRPRMTRSPTGDCSGNQTCSPR
jgi:hypothetical protein